MKNSRRELRYASEHFNEIHHTTLNPDSPGVVRIHLVPPEISDGKIEVSVTILNGQDIIPVNVSWSILLTEFIEEVNKYSGRPVTDDEVENILNNTCKNVAIL